MKKFLFLLPLVASFALVGCNSGDSGDDASSGDDTSGGETLPYSASEAKTKLFEYGESTGFEITFKTVSDGEDQGSATFGMKGKKYWFIGVSGSNSGYEVVDANNLKIYEYNEESSSYEATDFPYEGAEAYVQEQMNALTASLYLGSQYDGLDGFHKVKDLTFVGRSATEYQYSVVSFGVQASWKVIIDKDLGLTLYWAAQGSTLDGESGSASYEVTSFKTGNSAVAPF